MVLGSIPAHAGEPTFAGSTTGTCRGLSPRMRGNPRGLVDEGACMGSIPAHAGEPWQAALCRAPNGVYPRACGGTSRGSSPLTRAPGLSPRMRGNRAKAMAVGTEVGSIPAHAGEPPSASPPLRRYWVYPRACGGTCRRCDRHSYRRGLSPRMRGNPVPPATMGRGLGLSPRMRGNPSSATT